MNKPTTELLTTERIEEMLGWCDRVSPRAMKTIDMASGLSTLDNWYFQALTPDTMRAILTELLASRTSQAKSDDEEPYEVLGTSFDGVTILAPKETSKNFTREQIRAAIKALDPKPLEASRTSPATEAVAEVRRFSIQPANAMHIKVERAADGPWVPYLDYVQAIATPQPVAVKVTDEMVERLARYMAQDNGVPPDEPLYVGSETLAWHAWVEDARAALTAALSSGDAS